MISAFKHIRLSGQNLTPVAGRTWDGSSNLRLGFGNSGLAYYSELTGISGYLQDLINVANADVNKLNNLQGDLYITGSDGIVIQVNPSLGEIRVSGNSGYFQSQVDQLSTRLNQSGTNYYGTFATQTNLALTGSILDNKINAISGASSQNVTTISGQIALTGSNLDNKINALSGYVNSQDTTISTNLFNTGSALNTKIDNYSGWASATYVAKSTQQAFTTTLTVGLDEYQINYPVAFGTTPKVLATLEVPGNVMYSLSTRSIGTAGYTGVLSDNILEAGAKIHTFASTQ